MDDVFEGIYGHKNQLQFLRKVIENQSHAHGFCFSGISSIGKAFIAKRFASHLLKIEEDALASHSNVIHIQRLFDEKKKKLNANITVEQIRQLTTRLSLSSFDGGLKVAIIEDAHTMNSAAQNALLKTLEEPRGDTLIFLIATHEQKVLPTILSRTVHLRFHPLSATEMQKVHEDSDMIELSQGRPGILKMLSEGGAADLQEKLQEGRVFLKSSIAQRFTYIQKLSKEKDRQLILDSIGIWRYLIRAAMHKTAGTPVGKHLSKSLATLSDAETSIKQNGNTALALEHFALSI